MPDTQNKLEQMPSGRDRFATTQWSMVVHAGGVAVQNHPRRFEEGLETGPLHIGVIGQGVGTIAVYGRPGDTIRFYEINPDVIRMADEYFSYCRDSQAEVDIVLGDARVSLERALREGKPEKFDILAVDAFSSDSIPMHLLTRECMEIYHRHLAEDGILAIHISNKHLDLEPLVRGLVAEIGYEAVLISNEDDEENGVDSSDWVLVTTNQEFLKDKEVEESIVQWTDDSKEPVVWTDDFSNLFELIRWD